MPLIKSEIIVGVAHVIPIHKNEVLSGGLGRGRITGCRRPEITLFLRNRQRGSGYCRDNSSK